MTTDTNAGQGRSGPIFVVGRGRKSFGALPNSGVCPAKRDCLASFRDAPHGMWVTLDTKLLLRSIESWLTESDASAPRLGRLVLLEPPAHSAVPVLRSLFRDVAGDEPTYVFLPAQEVLEVLSRPRGEARDLFIGGCFDETTDCLVLVRGDLRRIVVPLRSFEARTETRPDPNRLRFLDCGQTVALGDYEAAADAVLYERDPEYRRRLHARRRREDQGFGPSLRRLRTQRGLSRDDFDGVSAKTIARVERGEMEPGPRARQAIVDRLGMSIEEIRAY
ncbi:MAG: helix-turn-helix transcriptional regulator [Candidatus Eisenbacteria bacterium]